VKCSAGVLAFPGEEGQHHTRSVLKLPFARIARLANITTRFTLHGCRRTAAALYRMTAGSVVARAIAGHTIDRMHEHYAVVSATEKRAAAERAFGKLRIDTSESSADVEPGTNREQNRGRR
jgi:integrase